MNSNTDKIKAFIPHVLALIGLIVAIATIYGPVEDKSAGFGLAGTAIAGAAGLAEPHQKS